MPTIEMNFAEKELKISVNLKATNAMLRGDEMHITNVIFNLLDNAAKYGGASPEIDIETHQTEKGIFLSVSDKGPGIAKEQQKDIFEKFYRISTGNVHDVKGSNFMISLKL